MTLSKINIVSKPTQSAAVVNQPWLLSPDDSSNSLRLMRVSDLKDIDDGSPTVDLPIVE